MTKHPYLSLLKKWGCKFYQDESYFDGYNPEGKDIYEKHPNGNICDTCDNPAQYMTFSPEPDDSAYYICEDCIKKFKMENMIED